MSVSYEPEETDGLEMTAPPEPLAEDPATPPLSVLLSTELEGVCPPPM